MEKVKLIKGSPERAKEIIKTLEKWGGYNIFCVNGEIDKNYYYVDSLGFINYLFSGAAKLAVSNGKAEIYELPPLQPKFTLKPFQKVLVRQTDDSVWECDIFSHIRNDEKYTSRYGCVGSYWAYCLPYEGNEYLLGTNCNP